MFGFEHRRSVAQTRRAHQPGRAQRSPRNTLETKDVAPALLVRADTLAV